jgi:hypothetical protein
VNSDVVWCVSCGVENDVTHEELNVLQHELMHKIPVIKDKLELLLNISFLDNFLQK